MVYGKSVNLFLVNGKADSLIVDTLSNWNATALKIPRIEVSNCGRSELQQPGVYFLICTDHNRGEKSVYIGESDKWLIRKEKEQGHYGFGEMGCEYGVLQKVRICFLLEVDNFELISAKRIRFSNGRTEKMLGNKAK